MIEKVTLNGTTLSVSRVCLGTMTFGAQTDEDTASAMVDFLPVNTIEKNHFLARGSKRNRIILTDIGIRLISMLLNN